MKEPITFVVDKQLFLLSHDAVNSYEESPKEIKDNLDIHFKYLSEIQHQLKQAFRDIKCLYVSSAWRKDDTKSPHSEGRGIDVSRIYLDSGNVLILFNGKTREWNLFNALVNEYFDKGKYNQIISPYGLKDIRRIDTIKSSKLINSHQDHFHLNIPKR